MGVPDWVVVPVGFGDGLSGTRAASWTSRRRHPDPAHARGGHVAVAPGGARGGADQPQAHPSVAPAALSIACPQSTYQAVHALRSTDGIAELVDDRQALAARRALGRREGMFFELSSAVAHAALAAARRRGAISGHELIVVVGTSAGMKDQPLPGDDGGVPPLAGSLEAVLGFLGLEPVPAAGA